MTLAVTQVPEANVAAPAPRPRRRWLPLTMFPISFAAVGALWEAYKATGPENGGKIFGWKLLPRAGNREMPHIWDMFHRLARPENGPRSETIAAVVAKAAFYSFRVALVAFALGVIIGLGLAMLMARFKLAERALMPYLVISQTVPIVGIAPVLVFILAAWSRSLGDQKWIAAAALGAFLAFFPIAVGALRGLSSAPPESIELMDSYAASWWTTTIRLRLPSSAPYLAPALRVAGAAAVVGVVVSEISVKINQGIGQLVSLYGQQATNDPSKLFTAVFGAAALGLAMSTLVFSVERALLRSRPVSE
jgi:NitT/TauT family transport system permease protein